jgi:hypothetical protein
MAYRVKGFLSLKQREAAIQFIKNYSALISSKDTDLTTKEMVRVTMYLWVLLLRAALYEDNWEMVKNDASKKTR